MTTGFPSAVAPYARLADELDHVLSEFQSKPGVRRWSLDDSYDTLLSGVIALLAAVFCFIEVGVTNVKAFQGISAFDSVFLVLYFLLCVRLYYFLRDFARTQRIKIVSTLIARLRKLEEPNVEDAELRFKLKRNVQFYTPTLRNNRWRSVPNNLLVKGDIVSLQCGQRAPTKVRRRNDALICERDALIKTSSAKSIDPVDFVSLVDMDEYEVEESPLVNDTALFLASSDSSQETVIGKQIRRVTVSFRLIASVGILVFGIALGVARFVVRRDGYGFERLVLLRTATLACLLPPLSWSLCRFLFEWKFYWRMSGLMRDKDGASGGNPFGFPLVPSTLVRVMGSLTALCGLDEDVLLFDTATVEEVFLLKGGKKTQVIDCCLDETGDYGLRFEDPHWRDHFSSLKPVGLVCALAGMEPSKSHSGQRPQDQTLRESLAEVLQERFTPRHLSQLASTMGFRPEDVAGLTVKSRLTLLRPDPPLSPGMSGLGSCNYPAAHLCEKPIVECMVVEVPDAAPGPAALGVSGTIQSLVSSNKLLSTAASSTLVKHNSFDPQRRQSEGKAPANWKGAGSGRSLASAKAIVSQLPPLPPTALPSPAPESRTIHRSLSASNLLGGTTSTPIPRPSTAFGINSKSSTSSFFQGHHNQPQYGTALHLLCWGNLSVLSTFCTEYWDGESIWSLDDDTRASIARMNDQWQKEDFDCVAFAYTPMSTPFPSDRYLFHVSKDDTDTNAVVVLPSSLPQSGQSLIMRSTTPPQDSPQHTPPPQVIRDIMPYSLEAQERKTQLICSNLSRGVILTGMAGSRDQPHSEVNTLVEHLHKCGVRFIYFSPREARYGRKIAEKMGLETDWNTSISIAREDEPQSNSHQHGHHHNQHHLGSSSSLNLYADWEQKARLPRGIEAIRRHIEEVDDVPLRVSVFTECAPGTIAEMIQVLRDKKEVVAGFGNPMAGVNTRATITADVSIAIEPRIRKNAEAQLSVDWGRMASSFTFHEEQSGVLLSLLGEGRIALYNYRQGNQCLVGLGVVAFLSQCAVFCASAPEMFALVHVLWLCWFMMPLLSAPPSLRPRKRQEMLWERMPWKQSALMVMRDPTQRYVFYALVRLVPVAAFVTGMFFWTLVTLDPNASDMLNWQKTVNATTFDPVAVQGAQSFALLAFTWAGCFLSASFASRTEVEKDLEVRFWVVWLFCSALAIGSQFAYNCVLSTVVLGNCTEGAFPTFPTSEDAVEHWLVLVLCPPVFVPLFAFPVKKYDRAYYIRAMQMMRLEFETKLGQFSPK